MRRLEWHTANLRLQLRTTWHRLYPWTALNGIDKRLIEFLPKKSGYFIEAGANDGIRQSNTYYLERRLGWQGLLVEPVPRLAARCLNNRSKSKVEQCLLVDRKSAGQYHSVIDLDLMSIAAGNNRSERSIKNQVSLAENVQNVKAKTIWVRGATLSELLCKHQVVEIDLLSLDVEGAEFDVLSGLDFDRHSPRFILIETQDLSRMIKFLGKNYELVAQFTSHDYLFRLVER